jgi:Flp pilus assembly protein TadG
VSSPGRRDDRERGAATAELVLVTPVMLFMVLLVVQFGLWFHASHVASAAAQEGARAARVEGSNASAGKARAEQFLDAVGSDLVLERVVTAENLTGAVRVEVSGRAIRVVPGLRLPISAESEGPVEEFRAP